MESDRRQGDRRATERGTGDRRQGERRGVERRSGLPDRRGQFRGGRRATDLVLAGALLGSLAGAGPLRAEPGRPPVRLGRRASDPVVAVRQSPPLPQLPPAPPPRMLRAATLPAMRFGTDVDSVGQGPVRALPLSFGVLWAGAWNEKYGWGRVEDQLRQARKKGVVPVVNWWYWGDEISPRAVEEGVVDQRHGVRKDKQRWYEMSRRLASLIRKEMKGREAIVVLETEFNKNGIERHAAFDGYLAETARIFHEVEGVKVVLGFGNWGRSEWARFQKAIAASDYLGIQLLQSSVRDASSYLQSVDTLVAAGRHIQRKFGKPSLVIDLALSSYGERFEAHQAAVLKELFARMTELKQAGVQGVIWRQMADDPKFDTSNYHGMAERYWGLLRADGTPKPALAAFLEGLRAESSGIA